MQGPGESGTGCGRREGAWCQVRKDLHQHAGNRDLLPGSGKAASEAHEGKTQRTKHGEAAKGRGSVREKISEQKRRCTPLPL